MYTNNKLSKAVRLAIAFGAASATAFTASVSAAEEDELAKVERIEVTGSRIKRTDIEGASPVVVIDRSALDISGQISVADVLRDTNFNSFGSFVESSGYGGGYQSTAEVSLRGLGAARTLVLINGKRMAPSPAGGGAGVNLNVIPFAAVERIEILSDGASAVYGSDAIGGVINVILRKDFDSAQLAVSAGRPSMDGGDENAVSFTIGGSSNRGSFVMSAEYDEKEIIGASQRDYTKSYPGATFEDSLNVSPAAKNIQYTINTGTFDEDGDPIFRTTHRGIADLCVGPGFEPGVLPYETDVYGEGSSRCAYDYTQIAQTTAGIKRGTIYTLGTYQVSDDINLTMSTMANRLTSVGVFAPAAGNFIVTGSGLANDLAADTNVLAPGETITRALASWRFAENGPRLSRTDELNLDFKLGLDGITNFGAWNVDVHKNVNTGTDIGTGYINSIFAQQYAAAGTLADPVSIQRMAHTTVTKLKTDYSSAAAGISVDELFELPGGFAGAYFHAEYMKTTYLKVADAESQAGIVIGSAGGSAEGDRSVKAVAAEIMLPVTDTIEVNLAGRFDNYSDFGSNFAPQASVKWGFADGWSLRSSYGQGFRAPSFDNLFAKSQGFPWVTALGRAAAQIETNTVGNPELEAEESTTMNIGIIGQVTDGVSFTLDYYDIEIENLIGTVSAQNLWNMYDSGTPLPPGLSVVVDATGYPEQFNTGVTNTGKLMQKGIDAAVDMRFETGMGTLSANLNASHVLSYKAERGFRTNLYPDYSGIEGYPDMRLTTRFGWSLDDHSLFVTFKYIASQMSDYVYDAATNSFVYEDEAGTGYYKKDIDSYLTTDVNYTWNAMDNLKLAFGVRNLTNEDPAFSNNGNTDYDFTLYSIQGRTYYGQVTYSF